MKIGDLVNYPECRDSEKQAALARRDLRWNDLEQLLLFPEVARRIRGERAPESEESC